MQICKISLEIFEKKNKIKFFDKKSLKNTYAPNLPRTMVEVHTEVHRTHMVLWKSFSHNYMCSMHFHVSWWKINELRPFFSKAPRNLFGQKLMTMSRLETSNVYVYRWSAKKVDFKRKIITEITICRAAGIDDFTEDSWCKFVVHWQTKTQLFE